MGVAIQPNCSLCGKPVVDKFKPFCSSRCATIDLGRWLGEGYAIPAKDEAEESELTSRVNTENEN